MVPNVFLILQEAFTVLAFSIALISLCQSLFVEFEDAETTHRSDRCAIQQVVAQHHSMAIMLQRLTV